MLAVKTLKIWNMRLIKYLMIPMPEQEESKLSMIKILKLKARMAV